jgi:hypothetical protein
MWPDDGAAIQDCLQRVDLADKLWQRCDQLSGGQRQRVGIARVLYQQPAAAGRRTGLGTGPQAGGGHHPPAAGEASASEASLLVSLHSVELALAYFPRIIGVRDGQIMFDLPREQVHPGVVSALYAGERLAEPGSRGGHPQPGLAMLSTHPRDPARWPRLFTLLLCLLLLAPSFSLTQFNPATLANPDSWHTMAGFVAGFFPLSMQGGFLRMWHAKPLPRWPVPPQVLRWPCCWVRHWPLPPRAGSPCTGCRRPAARHCCAA